MSRQILTRFKPDKKSAAQRQKIGQCAAALRVWFCLVEAQGDSATGNEKEGIRRVCAVSFHHAETP